MANNCLEIVPYNETDFTALKGVQCMKKWEYTNKETKKPDSTTQKVVELFLCTHDGKRIRLATQLNDLRSRQGITPIPKSQGGMWIQFDLTPEQYIDINSQFEQKIKRYLYDNRADLLAGTVLAEIEDMLSFAGYFGLVQRGKVKDPKVSTTDRWSDNITVHIPMKTKNKQKIIDESICQIVDEDGKPYSWANLDGKKFSEVIVELEKFVLKSAEAKAKWVVRRLVVAEKAKPQLVGKRKVVQGEGDAPAHAGPVAAPVSAPAASDTTQEPPAKKAKTALPGR